MRKSLDEGEVPDDWKTANISPVYKSGGRTAVNNYRPISLTSQSSKVIEAVLRDAILEQNCLIRDSQHGFRKGGSCLTNLLSFLDKVTDYVNEGSSMHKYRHNLFRLRQSLRQGATSSTITEV